MSLTSIALTGLRAAQEGLTTTGHNIANVNTAGYSRQQVDQSAATATFSGIGFSGNGVAIASVRRVYSDYLTQTLRQSTGTSASATALSTEVTQTDGYLADSSSNLSASIDAFFSSVQTVANNPSDASSRQNLLSTARTLAARFNDLGSRLQSQNDDVNTQIGDSVSQVNTLAQQVAALNHSILTDGRDPTNNQIPNDLLDQRDDLVKQISGLVGATAIPQSDGTLNVFVGSGQPLVVADTANTLQTVPDDQDASKEQLAVVVSGKVQRVSTAQVTSGTIGGLFQFRDQVLGPAQNSIGQVAIGLATALNAQNALGQDASGNPGAALFTVAAPAVSGRATNSVGSSLNVTISDATQLTAANYQLDYDGSQYTVTNLTDHTTHQYASLPQTLDGITIAAGGALSAGDRFTISPTGNGASAFAVATTDPSKIATAAPVALTTGANNTGSAQLSSLAVTSGASWPAGLQTPVGVTFHVSGSTTTYDLVDASTNAVISAGNAYTPGATISQNGWNLQLTGSPANNDTFTVGPNVGGTGDNRNALLLAGVQQKAVTALGSAQATYAGLVGRVGNQANEASSLATSQSTLLTQSQDARDSVSGVNLDEEAVNLQKYQQAYQAASKSIQTAVTMFDTILALFTAT